MPKIVFIGAGSFGFTRGLVRDLLTFPLLEGSEIALVDINKERLDFARRACQKIIDGVIIGPSSPRPPTAAKCSRAPMPSW